MQDLPHLDRYSHSTIADTPRWITSTTMRSQSFGRDFSTDCLRFSTNSYIISPHHYLHPHHISLTIRSTTTIWLLTNLSFISSTKCKRTRFKYFQCVTTTKHKVRSLWIEPTLEMLQHSDAAPMLRDALFVAGLQPVRAQDLFKKNYIHLNVMSLLQWLWRQRQKRYTTKRSSSKKIFLLPLLKWTQAWLCQTHLYSPST